MDYVKPTQLIEDVANAGAYKSTLKIRDILIKGILSGAFLGFATTLAFTATIETNLSIVGALVFPVGFVLILLLGLELVTGNFAMLPLARIRGLTANKNVVYNFFWAFLGNLIGSLLYGFLFYIVATKLGHVTQGAMIDKIIAVAEGKTIAYKSIGGDGLIVAFTKAILCNWMVTLGAFMAFISSSTIGKIAAMWLPVFLFFAHGFEHAVVNMFVIPTAILMGADITLGDWWIWNQIPVTIGNFIGGFIFTALALHVVNKKTATQTKNVFVTYPPALKGKEMN
ncbi:formate/nitrite transporter family protein [Bacillus sp. REN16]|uniref:formate/nitrite transporter family protein n=1 Tax=Bacillus sp. REN16 TaxID=2887296 RepID=UPI001E3C3C15|nr:formate/nitrite transporter family protein [Bacillus sp. REN16]MCC3359016.1 formate/nitrite transporter family protein [Bacillus sp. REN16]